MSKNEQLRDLTVSVINVMFRKYYSVMVFTEIFSILPQTDKSSATGRKREKGLPLNTFNP